MHEAALQGGFVAWRLRWLVLETRFKNVDCR